MFALYAIVLILYARQVRVSGKVVHPELGVTAEPVHENMPSVTVVVPFKDEEVLIASCLESVLQQDYPALDVIAVNDRSVDESGSVVRRLQEKHEALRLDEIRELPDEMFGKPHALHEATANLKSDLVIFLDSDFHMEPGCIRSLVQQFMKENVDWIAVMARPDLVTGWERMLMPFFGAMVYAWHDPARIADPDNEDALGSGFMIVRREAYEAVGRHGAVVRAYDEDSELLRVAKRAKQRVSYLMAPQIATVRFYGGLSKLVHGLTRTLIGGLKNTGQFIITITSVQFVSLMPFAVLIGAWITAPLGSGGLFTALFAALAIVHMAISISMGILINRVSGVPAAYCLLQPVTALVMTIIVARAAILRMRNRKVSWRGTQYDTTAVTGSQETTS
ncbi:MAG: glycosyltransferase family 2 protein [Phycisphaerales bacterium]|nr:glycosyltransferase family 2 protein [Phycisphaerales bacterium]